MGVTSLEQIPIESGPRIVMDQGGDSVVLLLVGCALELLGTMQLRTVQRCGART